MGHKESTETIDKHLNRPVRWRATSVAFFLLSFFGLFFSILTSPAHLIYDEPYHLGLSKLILTEGLVAAMNSPENESAAGVVYPAIHIAVQPFTQLTAPSVRFVNLILTLLLACVLTLQINRLHSEATFAPLLLLGIPFLWPTIGIALTEIPGLLFYSIHCGSMVALLRNPSPPASSIPHLAIAGISLGIAILTRQTYLVALGPLI